MRIGYYVPPTLLEHDGIRRRALATLDAWQRLGHESVLLEGQRQPRGAVLLRHLQGDRDAAAVARVLVARHALEHVHLRLLLPTRGWLGLGRDVPMSLEIHAGLRRPENARDLARVVLGAGTSRALVRSAAAGVFVTRELSGWPEFRSLSRRTAIGNGVPLGPVLPAPTNVRPTVGMVVGSAAKWQGIDMFDRLAARHPNLAFVLVAPRALQPYLRGALQGGNVAVALTADRAEYVAALGRLDVAVGSLALGRKGLSEAAPLKVRDSVAAGIPTVLPYHDTNLSEVDDVALLQSADPLIDPRFRGWVQAMVGKRVAETTRQAISIDTLERRRLDLLRG